jgi:hypothetical protein
MAIAVDFSLKICEELIPSNEFCIAFDKISLPTKYQRRKNIGDTKISLSTKYRCRQNIGDAKLLLLTKYRH